MSNSTQSDLGSIVSLWRYPVKSMMGEELQTTQINEYGFIGDRAYALLDQTDGKVATAKNPRKWPNLFAFQAALETSSGTQSTSVRITLPDGTVLAKEQSDLNQVLSKALNREVALATTEKGQVSGVQSSIPTNWTARSEEYRPEIEGLDHQDTVADFALPTGTFFDSATIHLLTTATLKQLQSFYPQGRFEVQRFRPNIVIDAGDEQGFPESSWVGQTLAIGEEVRLTITGPCGRCVMTTLAQGDLPKDQEILRTALKHQHGQVGVYASVVQGGTIRKGDRIRRAD